MRIHTSAASLVAANLHLAGADACAPNRFPQPLREEEGPLLAGDDYIHGSN